MKQQITYSMEQSSVVSFINDWKKRKNYTPLGILTIGECIELMIGTSYNLHFEESDGRFFNKILTNHESIVGWDGQELIDILYYELIITIKRRIAMQGTYLEEQNDQN